MRGTANPRAVFAGDGSFGHSADASADQWLHYQRMFTPPDGDGGRVLLHFGAVDNSCVILVNHREVGRHSGGYWPFSLDITDYLQDGENTLHVAVQDASDGGIQAHGKQKLTPAACFIPRRAAFGRPSGWSVCRTAMCRS